jgi:trimethylamine-N-oxide reductase (cytochrome c)
VPDLGGCVNLLTPSRRIAAKTHGMAPNSCLVWDERAGAVQRA